MIFRTKSEFGMTLIEVLATLVIASIIAIFIFNFIKSSTDQNIQQTKETGDLFDISYALKVITKDIRRSEYVDIDVAELKLIFPNNNEVKYVLEGNQLKKELIRYTDGVKKETLYGIGCFKVNFTTIEEKAISLELANKNDCSSSKKTKIQLRKEL
ncbi:hypothetical protein A9986_15140 [Solibacillus silvestris]|nr:prepilin-type N-terminal cleavage/methylation domain-containing protein [Solibacillus silvestris]OBW53504.1 hypothetical protein A9986_15140 [Solibacillus silvestris]